MNSERHHSPSKHLFVVGIASSAGGLTPLIQLIERAACHKNMTFMLVPHLSREYKTRLPALLGKVTDMQTELMRDGAVLEACRLMILPPAKYAYVERGRIRLKNRPPRGTNQSANTLFESLAENFGPNSIGVVLSGSAAGADGSQGVIAIKKAGGHTYAQSPETADYPQMPELAIETGRIDSIMPAAQIGHELSLVDWASQAA